MNPELEQAIIKEVPSDDSATREEKMLLYWLIRAIKPKTVVETGTHKGLATLYMAAALEDNGEGHLWTADPFEWGARGNFAKFLPLNARITYQQIPGKDLDVKNIDFLFIDGFHEKHEVLAEIDALFPRLSPEATVVFHDADVKGNEYADVHGAIQESKIKAVYLPTKNRLRVYNHIDA